MDDNRIWDFEHSLWVGDEGVYRERVDPECLMALPAAPYVFSGEDAIAAVGQTPRWKDAAFADRRVSRPQEGLIVIAYAVAAQRDDKTYEAYCTSTYRRLGHDDWRVVQHSQTLAVGAAARLKAPDAASSETEGTQAMGSGLGVDEIDAPS